MFSSKFENTVHSAVPRKKDVVKLGPIPTKVFVSDVSYRHSPPRGYLLYPTAASLAMVIASMV